MATRAQRETPPATWSSWATSKQQWLLAQRWRVRVEQRLLPLKLTLTQWLVLEAAAELVQEADDAVSQTAIAARSELNKMTVSHVMRALEKADLVSRGPDQMGSAYRIWVTDRGSRLVRQGRKLVERIEMERV